VANDYSVLVPQMLARGLKTLRENLVMARLSLRRYDYTPGIKGSTVEVPVPSPLSTNEVAPGAVSVQPQDSTPTVVNIPVDQWHESAFGITDKEMVEARSDSIMMQADEAMKAIANKIDGYLWDVAVDYLNEDYSRSHGTPGTTPFAAAADGIGDIDTALSARARLDDALCPMDDRYVVMNPDAEANLLQQRRFADMSYSGTGDVIIRGMMGERFGLNWVKTQMADKHTTTDTGFQTAEAGSVGDTEINVDKGTTNFQATPNKGDVFTFAGSTLKHIVTEKTANKAANNTTAVAVKFSPALVASPGDNAAITLQAKYVSNIVMHRDFLAFVSKPQVDEDSMRMFRQAGNGFVESVVDPVSGVALRAMLVRQHYQWRFSFDALWGAKVIRGAFGRRIYG
jgi:hypothetical protein